MISIPLLTGVGGHAVAAGVTAQALDDLDTLAEGCAEVLQTHRQVALVDVVRTYTYLDDLMHELLHHVNAVVDTAQQHALVAQGDTGVGQHLASTAGLGSHLVGMVEVGIDPDGMILLQHVAQLGRDALRAHDGSAGTQANDLDVRNLPQLRDDILKSLIAHHQSVTAREQDVTHGGRVADILESLLDAIDAALVVGLTGKAATGAVTAVHRAHVGDQEQHAIGITVCQAGRGRILILMQGVEQIGSDLMCLKAGGDALAAHGIVRIIGIDEAQIIRSDSHTQGLQGLLDTFFLLSSKAYILLEFLKGLDAVFHLPFPVIPLLVGNVRK